MADGAVQKVVTAEAWTEFCDLLKKAGDVILREDLARSSFDRAEGHRSAAPKRAIALLFTSPVSLKIQSTGSMKKSV